MSSGNLRGLDVGGSYQLEAILVSTCLSFCL
jgi:hypothetical protein